MTDKEKLDAIRAEIHRLVDVRGYDREMANDLFTFMDSIPNEPVSEDLEEEVIKKVLYFSENFHKAPWAIDSTGVVMPIWYAKFGADWQVKQFEKNRLKHCDSITNEQAELEQGFLDQHLDKHQRIPTFLDAIEYGMNLQKEQMMKDAVDATVHIDTGNYPYIPQIELYDYDKDVPLAKEGDKYKVVLIKEE